MDSLQTLSFQLGVAQFLGNHFVGDTLCILLYTRVLVYIPTLYLGGYFPIDTVEASLQYLAISILGSLSRVTTKTATATLTTIEAGIILCNKTIAMTIDLPTAIGNTGLSYFITNINTGTVTIDPFSTQTLQSESTFDLYQDENINIVTDGSNWYIR